MKILSKAHSASIISKLNLNRVPEVACNIYEASVIRSFCDKHVSKKYILRDLENPNGKYFFCSNKEECLSSAKQYLGAFSLAVSCFAYENIVLLGEIYLTKDSVTIVGGNAKDINHRNAYQKSIINTCTTLNDDKIWEVDGVEDLIAYIVKHNLYDVIVEYVVYDKPVGINNEKVLIVELRSDY